MSGSVSMASAPPVFTLSNCGRVGVPRGVFLVNLHKPNPAKTLAGPHTRIVSYQIDFHLFSF